MSVFLSIMAKRRVRKNEIPFKSQRKPQSDDPLEVEAAKHEGNNFGVKHKFTTPASRKKRLSHLIPLREGEQLSVVQIRQGSAQPYFNALAERIRAIGQEEIEDTTGRKWKRVDALIRAMYVEGLRGNKGAAEVIFERGWGKVPAPVQVDLRAEVIQIKEQSGLSWSEIMADPILSQIAQAAGVVVEGEAKLLEAGPSPSDEPRGTVPLE